MKSSDLAVGPMASPHPTAVEGSEISLQKARVLVVDDDERNLLAMSHVLQDVAEVVLANSGEEALRQLLKAEFAVILLDVYMPGIDGYETARIIRSREQTKRVPIVFLTAVNKDDEHLLRGYAMGAVDYVFKPVEPMVVRSKVTVFVDLFNMTKEVQRKARLEQQLLDANLRANAERLRIEQDLRRAEQRQAAIIHSLPIILYLEDLAAQARVPKFVSGNFAALTGFELSELQASPGLWSERLHPDDRDRVLAALADRPSRPIFSTEYRWRCADGSYRHFLDQAVLLPDPSGNPVEYAGTLLDITERKELESQLTQARKMDAIGQLTGGIAHDFNNLLAAVLGGLGLIERRLPLTEEHLKIVGMTRHAAEQGAELVKRLLAFARRQKLEPEVINVASLAGSVADLLEHSLGGLVELKWDVRSDIGRVYADPTQLELALMNLIINARDAMPEGGVVTISAMNAQIDEAHASKDLVAGDYIVLTVEDQGTGISPEILDQVLEPFFTTKAVGKGTGLGLSMVYGFARQSGGSVRVESEVGVGTSVSIWLPQPSALSLRRHLLDDPSKGLTSPVGLRFNILLVDDNIAVRATTAALLQDLGHTVKEAGDAEEALDLFRIDPMAIDIVVSDYAMPRTSGTDLVRHIRALRPGTPALIVTGYAEQAISSEVTILTKPFEADHLTEFLNKVWEDSLVLEQPHGDTE
ncbi:response regulator [Sphingobium sp. EP60837]|uniref:response regulator n=1 Tax=Sphingobium sp. EP60837 TaxID=1855519 RepID=UPI0007DDD960|nr:response regulator [Sphingobium sp. EP60837]ANI79432.1 Blue-light-activated protein [Sphingobium sp. EP60837]